MKISKYNLFLSFIFASFFRFIIFPLDDYPDIFYIYRKILNSSDFLGLVRIFNLSNLFEGRFCGTIRSPSLFFDYLLGGGYYKCQSLPFTYNYFFYYFLISFVFLLLILFFYKLSTHLGSNKNLYRRIIFNLTLLPSVPFFLLAFHIDVPHHFLSISFVMVSFYLSFLNRLKYLYPIIIVPFFIVKTIAPDNQSVIEIGIFLVSLLSFYLSKNKFVINLLDKFALQFKRILARKFAFSKNLLFLFLIPFVIIIFLTISYRGFLINSLASIFPVDKTFLSTIFTSYFSDDNQSYEIIFKYPILFRIFGTIQGLIISTPFGIKPSLITTLVFLTSFFKGFLRIFSLESKIFPNYIKLFFISSSLMIFLTITLFPFFSYSKYYVFLTPFLALFMSFTPRLSLIGILMIYFELALKSFWLS